MSAPIPSHIELHQQSKTLELRYASGEQYQLSCEFLRVHSPSAEVKGHGPGQEVLQFGKKNVNIQTLQAVGNYAIQPFFDDGHDTGIYSWAYLYELCQNQEAMWQDYLDALREAKASRDPDVQVIELKL